MQCGRMELCVSGALGFRVCDLTHITTVARTCRDTMASISWKPNAGKGVTTPFAVATLGAQARKGKYEGLEARRSATNLEKAYRFATEWPAGSLAFFAAMLSHVVAGVFCVVHAPETRDHASGVNIPDSATCLRVTRHSDFSTVDVALGHPSVQLSALLRLDGVKGSNESDNTVRFFSQDVVESTTVECSLEGSCTDVMYTADGTRRGLRLNYGEFAYRQMGVERALYTTASQIGGVSGEMFLREGNNYWLTATHLCYTTDFVNASGIPVRLDEGTLTASVQDLASKPLFESTPSVEIAGGYCNATRVSLFPELASIESTWLSVADTGLYSSAPDNIDARRTIAEVGVDCAHNVDVLTRDLKLYKLDCAPYLPCRNTVSLPFRRLATSSIFLSLATPGNYYVNATTDDTLNSLPRLANSTSAFYSSLLKMLTITLAAAVVYVRSRKKTASSSWLMKNCLSICGHRGPLKSSEEHYEENEFEDQLVGLVAISARLAVVAIRFYSLSNDDQLRVCVAELVGVGLSVIHFVLRYGVLIEDQEESPISKLGGSTAIADSTVAVMLSFSETPTLVSASSSFNPTARMLVALVISTVVVTRCVFSAACCGVLWPPFHRQGRKYAYVLMYSSAAWCVQCAILAVASCDPFVSPAAYSMSRGIAANADAASLTRLVLFLSVTASGLPRLVATSRHILSYKEHVD